MFLQGVGLVAWAAGVTLVVAISVGVRCVPGQYLLGWGVLRWRGGGPYLGYGMLMVGDCLGLGWGMLR